MVFELGSVEPWGPVMISYQEFCKEIGDNGTVVWEAVHHSCGDGLLVSTWVFRIGVGVPQQKLFCDLGNLKTTALMQCCLVPQVKLYRFILKKIQITS